MQLEFREIITLEDQQRLAQMAREIWNEYWPPLIGQDQVDYMVERFQCLDAIKRDMAEHDYEYWFIWQKDNEGTEGDTSARVIGYTGGHPEPETNRYFISKIYLLKDERGRGVSKHVIDFYDQHARKLGFHATYLTVNKYNTPAVRSYEKSGFLTIDSVETDIGQGFIMDDYIMERAVN